ncbi:MAG: plastocyanin [Gammaproteobacteria bacterium]|jgi:plastocyanin
MIFKLLKKYSYLPGMLLLIQCLTASAETLTVTIKDAKGSPVPNAVIYAVPLSPASMDGAKTFEIEQRNKEFNPFVSVVPIGATINFPNHDGIGHHVYSFSPIKTFELPLSEKLLSNPIVFEEPGVITVGCNIHDWMVGYIYVVDTPYYATSDINGSVYLNNIPANDYSLHVWHPGINSIDDKITRISLNQNTKATHEFTIDLGPEYLWKPVHPPEDEEEQY